MKNLSSIYVLLIYCFQKNKVRVKTDRTNISFPADQNLFPPFFLISYAEIWFDFRALKWATTFQKHKHLINWEMGVIWRGGGEPEISCCQSVCPVWGAWFPGQGRAGGNYGPNPSWCRWGNRGLCGRDCPACSLLWRLSLPSHPFSRKRVSEAERVPQPGQAQPVQAGHDA